MSVSFVHSEAPHFSQTSPAGMILSLIHIFKTGRTHQIRVHMASIQHPVAGDPVYGPHNCITRLHGQCLHAKTLGFIHPITGEHLRFDSELPEYFTHFIASLRRGTV